MMDRLLLALRWAALAIALGLNLWGPAPVGFTHEPETTIFALSVYNAIVSYGSFRWKWLTPHRLLMLDTAVFTVGIVMTGGWHSSLFVLYFLVVLAAAAHLRTAEAVGYTSFLSLLYVAACVPLPNWDWMLSSIEVLVGRVMTLLFTGLASAALFQQLETERRLRKGEQEVNSRLTVLNELMSLELGSKLDLDRTLEGIARLARTAIRAEFTAVCLFPGQDHPGFRFAFDGVPADQQGNMFRDAHLDPIGEVVVRTGQPLLIADVSRDDAEMGPLSSFYRCRSLVCVPIKLDDAVIGVLYNGVQSPDQIDQSDVDLLVAMGRHTALAIANARMYDRELSNVARLRELERAKSDFLSTVSHQLRTPITSVATSADLLMAADSNLTEDQKRLVQNIARNSVRLGNLVTDLLQMARLREGRLELSRQAVTPVHIISDAVAGVKILFDARDQTVEVRANPGLPRVEADRKRIEHVLVNLLSNACKFTQRGGVVVVEATAHDGMVEFAVRDNGPGMDPAVQDRIFEPFFSADGAEGQGGTGLGMAIAKGVVELHGGEIWVESAPGAGSTVHFTLPIASDQK